MAPSSAVAFASVALTGVAASVPVAAAGAPPLFQQAESSGARADPESAASASRRFNRRSAYRHLLPAGAHFGFMEEPSLIDALGRPVSMEIRGLQRYSDRTSGRDPMKKLMILSLL